MLSRVLAIKLISYQFKSFVRNEKWRRNIISRLISGVTIIVLVFGFLFVGRYIKEILKEVGGEPVATFNSVIVWYFAGDLIQRCSLQSLPTLQVVPFLRLPVRRLQLINWLLFRSLWNVFNLIPFMVVVPFIVRILAPRYGEWAGVTYFTGIFLLVLQNNFLAVLIGFLSKRNLMYMLIPLGIFAGLYFSRYLHFSVTSFSKTAGQFLVNGRILFFLLLSGSIAITVWITHMILAPHFYIDEMTPSKDWTFTSSIPGLDNFKKSGEIKRNIWLELNLILRNKRPRQVLGLTPLFLMAYFVYILSADKTINPLLYLLIISMVSGLLPTQYGQFLFSWESSYFDGIMARKNDFSRYVQSKYYLMIILAMIGFFRFI